MQRALLNLSAALGAIGANRTVNGWGFANESADFDLRKQE